MLKIFGVNFLNTKNFGMIHLYLKAKILNIRVRTAADK